MTVPTREQRHFSRIPFQAQVQLSGQAGTADVMLVDLSLRGALVEPPAAWRELAPGTGLELHLRLGDDASVAIYMETEVVHHAHGRMGLRCTHIDLDSVTQLRRLVAMNLGDAAVLERELSALG